jgi:hypothetical protein
MLVVDPTCPFAEQRAASIGGLATSERARNGLKLIARALKLDIGEEFLSLDNIEPDDFTLLSMIHQVQGKEHIELKFYKVIPSGLSIFLRT